MTAKNGWHERTEGKFVYNQTGLESFTHHGSAATSGHHGLLFTDGDSCADDQAFPVCRSSACFTGLAISLPLSLVGWAVVLGLIYLAIP